MRYQRSRKWYNIGRGNMVFFTFVRLIRSKFSFNAIKYISITLRSQPRLVSISIVILYFIIIIGTTLTQVTHS